MPGFRFSFGDLATITTALVASGVVLVSFYVFSPLSQFEKLEPLISKIESAQNDLLVQNELIIDTISQMEDVNFGIEQNIARFENIILSAEEALSDEEARFILQNMRANSDQFDQRIERIEKIFAQNPERAIDAKILRNELRLVRDLLDARVSSADRNIERLYSMFGWSFGGIVLFIIVQALGRVVQSSRSSRTEATAERKEK